MLWSRDKNNLTRFLARNLSLNPCRLGPSRQRRPTGPGSRSHLHHSSVYRQGCSTRRSSTLLNSDQGTLRDSLKPTDSQPESSMPSHFKYNLYTTSGLIIVEIKRCSCHFVLLFFFSLINWSISYANYCAGNTAIIWVSKNMPKLYPGPYSSFQSNNQELGDCSRHKGIRFIFDVPTDPSLWWHSIASGVGVVWLECEIVPQSP